MRFLATLTIGALGGALFYLLRLPLPWMLGSMTCCMAAVMLGAPVASTRRFRPPLVAVIGVTLGSSFSAEAVGRVGEWYPVLSAILVSGVISAALCIFYLVKVARLDGVTAYFAGVPGGLYEMVFQGEKAGGDPRSIALIQALRVFLVVLMVPLFFRLSYGLGSVGPAAASAGATSGDVLFLAGCALIGWPLAAALRLPNPPLFGPLLFSAAVHSLDLTHSAPPQLLVGAVQVILGTSVAGQFVGSSPTLIKRLFVHGLAIVCISLVTCVTFAGLISHYTGLDQAQIVLALAPGGMTEMCLIALAMHADVAFVTVHQLLRIALVQLVAPFAFRLVRRKNGKS